MKKDKYVAHYSANNDTKTFQEFEQAKKWLEEQWQEDGSEGFSDETITGEDFIAKITHRSKYIMTKNRDRDGYKWNEEESGYFLNGNPEDEEWVFEFDEIGEIILEETVDPET